MATRMAPRDVDPPLHKSAQRMRWFIGAFEEQIERTSRETGTCYRVDQICLAEVFAEWLKAFRAQKPADSADNPSYVGFAAGLMLKTLIAKRPVTVEALPEGADASNPAYFWPEGYLYVAFCLNVRGLVISTDYHGEQHPGDELGDLRAWWSFKENVERDSGLAIAFLDLFAGEEPEWTMPELFRSGPMRQVVARFYTPEIEEPDGR